MVHVGQCLDSIYTTQATSRQTRVGDQAPRLEQGVPAIHPDLDVARDVHSRRLPPAVAGKDEEGVALGGALLVDAVRRY